MTGRLPQRDERGAIALIVGLLSIVLLGISAFTVDFGMAYTTKRQLSTAADAASLAADKYYKDHYQGLCTVPGNDPKNPSAANANVLGLAEKEADSLFTQNYPKGTDSDGTITDVRCNGTGVQVTYTASGTSGSPFGQLLGGSGTITTAGDAAAAYSVGGGICALCVLGDVNTNNTDFTVTGGDIYVDGNVGTGPNSNWTATNSITISGTVSGLSQAHATPDYTSGPHITDPFAGVTLPVSPWTGLQNKGTNASPCTQGPGIYGSYNIKNETCTLAPGAYVFTGTLSFQNTGSHLTSGGQPVTLFFAGPNGKLDIKNGDIDQLAAPTTTPLPSGFPAGWPAGFAIIYSRDNTTPLDLQGIGDSFPDVTGNVYALRSTTSFNGNACFQVSGGAVVIGGVSSVGNKSCLNVLDAKNAGNALPQNLRLTK
jgi:Flp pilus assembly protein TadG